MALWSTKRRLVYGGTVVSFFLLVLAGLFFVFFYRAPTCSDGNKNGDETGVDCGGSCLFLCTSDSLSPIVLWSKIFNISGDVYSAVAYVENPNINSKNSKASYEFGIFDANNKLLKTVAGQTQIPKNMKFAVFETGIVLLSGQVPKYADLKFTSFSKWQKDLLPEPDLTVKYSPLLSTSTIPRVEGNIYNESLKSIPELELVVFVLDGKENVVAASRTFIDNLVSRTTQDFVFTWPKPFNLGVEVCANPVDLILLLDRSGSMRSESISPPEPFDTVKATAKDFIKNLGDDDQVGIYSFGTQISLENPLSSNKQLAISAIDNLFLSTTTIEQTNISGALISAQKELTSERASNGSKKIIILLTDGVPTEPTLQGTSDYPVISAEAIAKEIKASSTILYSIGLGKNVREGFLKTISFDDAHYFSAPTKENLANIYAKIGSTLCQKKPNVITIISRTL